MPTKCFTKATKTGKKYTACVDTKTFKKKGVKGNAKSVKATAKGVMVVRKKIKTTRKLKNKSTITPPLTQSRRRPDGYKQEGQKKMSAGMSVLMTSGLMSRIGKAVITKKEKSRRREVVEKAITRNTRGGETMLGKAIKSREEVFRERADYSYRPRGSQVSRDLSNIDAQRNARRIKWKNTLSKKFLKSLQNKRKKITTLLNDYKKLGGDTLSGVGNIALGRPLDFIKDLDHEIGEIKKIIKTPDNKISPTTYKQDRIEHLRELTKEGPPMYPPFWSKQGRIGGDRGKYYDDNMSELEFLSP
tara:strand:- start:36 stop:941 length:906 start_codon:yes stop_codon:yes gene_type:complete